MSHEEETPQDPTLVRPLTSGLVKAVVVISTVLAAVLYFQSYELTHRINQTLSCYVRDSLDRSEKALPANAYFKQHPNELSDALVSIAEQRQNAIQAWGVCEQPRPNIRSK